METAIGDIVRRAQAGNREAFADLMGRCERTALGVAFAALADADLAGDVVQEAFVRAWQRLGELREPECFAGWLCGIVRNLAHDVRRRDRRECRVREAVTLGSAGGEIADPAMEFERKEADERLAAALATLDELSRTAVVLRYYEGLSSKQIGSLLDLAPAAVDMRLMRARRHLRRRLDASEERDEA